jgi:hypothetical protein
MTTDRPRLTCSAALLYDSNAALRLSRSMKMIPNAAAARPNSDPRRARNHGREREDVVPAHMIRDVHHATCRGQLLGARNGELHPGDLQDRATPGVNAPLVHAVGLLLDSKQTRDDDDGAEYCRQDENGEEDDRRPHQREK